VARPVENTVAALADELLLAIVHGRIAPGSRLPSVRALAEEHGVNVSTVQRVLARLEEAGVVVARPRSGVVVLDPRRHGDGLAARRVLALDVVRALTAVPPGRYLDELRGAIEGFAAAVSARPRELRVVAESESEIIRTILVSVGRSAVLAIYNDITAMLFSSAHVLAALYRRPEAQLTGWRMFLELLASRSMSDSLAFVEPLLTAHDARAVAAYAASLGVSRRRPPSSSRTRRKKP
jgi:DNA-binding GntR family transcriptional regulator